MFNYGLRALIVIIVGIGYGIYGTYKLIKMKQQKYVIGYLCFAVGYPILLIYFINSIENMSVHLRIWIFIPLFILGLFWLFLGFVINKKAENLKHGINYKDDKTPKRRMLGGGLLLLSICIWYISVVDNSESLLGYILLISCSIFFICGLLYLITGKPFGKIDD